MSTEKSIKKFAENLTYLRGSRRMSQEELAKKCRISDKTVLRYESGNYNPNMNTVLLLANALDANVEDFFKENLEYEHMEAGFEIKGVTEKFEKLNYREGFKIPESLQESIKKLTIDRLMKYNELTDLLGEKIKFSNPLEKLGTIKTKNDAEKAAIKVRRKWNIGSSPILSVINTLENHGIHVIEFDAPEEFEGLSAYVNSMPVVVLNNSIKEKTRRRFTALHELGHLILTIDEDVNYKTMERICDAFAAAMLIPKELLILELGQKRNKITRSELKAIKEKYGISVNAILVGSAYSKIIEWDDYYELKGLSGLGEYHGNESSTKFKQMVYRGIIEGQISALKAKYFGINQRMFNNVLSDAFE